MAKRINIDKDFCMKFNEIRNAFSDTELDKNELLEAFADIHMKSHHIATFVKHDVFTLHRLGKKCTYTVSSTPVYIEKLRVIYKEISSTMKQYAQNKSENKPVVKCDNDIEAAIKLLKSEGYKIFKPTTSYEEV